MESLNIIKLVFCLLDYYSKNSVKERLLKYVKLGICVM
jgi:hypothetical protein